MLQGQQGRGPPRTSPEPAPQHRGSGAQRLNASGAETAECPPPRPPPRLLPSPLPLPRVGVLGTAMCLCAPLFVRCVGGRYRFSKFQAKRGHIQPPPPKKKDNYDAWASAPEPGEDSPPGTMRKAPCDPEGRLLSERALSALGPCPPGEDSPARCPPASGGGRGTVGWFRSEVSGHRVPLSPSCCPSRRGNVTARHVWPSGRALGLAGCGAQVNPSSGGSRRPGSEPSRRSRRCLLVSAAEILRGRLLSDIITTITD